MFLSLLQAEVAGGDSKGFLAEAILEALALTGRRQRGGGRRVLARDMRSFAAKNIGVAVIAESR